MRALFMFSILAVVFVILSNAPQDAHATSYTLDQSSCQNAINPPGQWNTLTLSCTIEGVPGNPNISSSLASGDTLSIPASTGLDVASGSTFTNNGEIDISGNGGIGVDGAFINSGIMNNRGSFDNAANVSNSGTINNMGSFYNFDSANLIDNGLFANSGTITNQKFGTIDDSGTITNSGTINNNGKISVFPRLPLIPATLVNSGIITSTGSFAGINNLGTMYMIGSFSGTPVTGISPITSYVISDLSSCQSLIGTWNSNTCTINSLTVGQGSSLSVATGTTVEFTGTVTNNGFLAGSGQFVIAKTSTVTNNNTFNPGDGSSITNDGTIDNMPAGDGMDVFGPIINSGTINNSGNIEAGQNLTSTGTITNSGALFISKVFENNGTVTNTDLIHVFSGAVLENFGTIVNKNSLTNDGTFNIECGSTVTGTVSGNRPVNQCETLESPTLAVASPANNTITNSDMVTISGTSSDSISVLAITWKIDSGPVSTAMGTNDWHFSTGTLPAGRHLIEINATNLADLYTETHLGITIYVTAPDSLSAQSTPFQTNLSWNEPPIGGGTAITNFDVYRGTSSGSEAKITTIGNVTSYSDTSAVFGQTYYYYVTAANAAGESGKSNEVVTRLASSYDVSNQTSCLALPQSAKPTWSPNFGSPLCTLGSGGKIMIPSGASLSFDMPVENNGLINNTGYLIDNNGLSNVGGTVLNYGTMAINGGALNTQASINNFGILNLSAAGSLSNNGGNIVNVGNVKNNGRITNFNGGITNNNAGGIINNTSGGTISNNQGGTTNNNAGATINNNSGGIYDSGGTTNNGAGAVININSGFIDNNVSGGTMTNLGIINNNSGDLQNNHGGVFTNSGIIKDGCGGTILGAISGTAPVNTCDAIPPTTTASLSGTVGENNWYVSPVIVTLTATDNAGGSGVKTTSYSLDGGPQTKYTGQFTISGDSNHTVAFNSTDNAGNTESPNLIHVAIDTTPPVIAAPTDVTMEASGPLTMVSLGVATATDAVDGPVTVTSNATASYPVGTTRIQYFATDLAGNTAAAYQTVTVTDTTPPVLQLPVQITVQATGPSGAAASYRANATDLVDGPVTPVCNPPSGSTFAYGNTTVTCTAEDAHGNKATGTFGIDVQNKIPPAISISSPSNNVIVQTANPAVSGIASDIVSISKISWKVDTGMVSQVPGVTAGPSISWSFAPTLSPGTHTIQVNATDSAVLVASSQITVTYAAPTDSFPPPTGSGQVTFTSSNGGFTSLDSIQQSSLPTSPPSGSYPLGFFSWDITGFAPATSVTITVTSPALLPSQSQYFKLIGGTWIPIPVTISGNTMKFTISDNGPYDGNPTTGVISDPAAIADPTNGGVTGGGNIGKGTNFGFELQSNLDKANPIHGTFAYHDRYVKLDLHSNKISYLSVDPTTSQATFVGTGTYDRHYGHDRHDIHDTAGTFLVSVTDPDKTGDHDTLSITVTNSTGYIVYQNSGAVKGHIEIHKFPDQDDRSDSGLQQNHDTDGGNGIHGKKQE